MNIIIKNYPQLSAKAATMVLNQLALKPDSVFGLATGSTPLGMYQEIIKAYRNYSYDFSKVKTFNLDEYYGLPKTHQQSYYYFMQKNLFKHLNIKKQNVQVPNATAKDVKKYCQWYEGQIKKHPIDLQILGLGSNGHIGFNEPGSGLDSKTRLVKLDKKTISDNARFFKNVSEVPKQAITMGIATIMQSKKIVLLASGKNKAKAIKQMVEGRPSANCPASWLQLHDDVTVIVDKEAASLLKKKN